MINKSSLIFYKGEMMIKYHNNLNKIALKGFNQRELGIFFAICSIMKEKGIQELEITFSELEKIVGISFKDKSELVDYIRNMSRKLLDLKIESSENGVFINFVLFRTLITDTNTEKLTIRVNEDFSYILNDLTKHFTLFELKDFNQLNSIYAKHLYRLLKQFKYTGMFRIEISEFRRLFDIPMSYRMTDINRRVLTPAMKEVSQFFTSLSLIKEKEGKNIKYLKFTFDKEKRVVTKEDNTVDISIDQSKLALIDQPKENIVCPKCGQLLSKCTAKNGDIFWGHKNYLTSDCKATFSTIEEIEAEREKRLNLIENEADRAKFEKEVKELINQHKDIVKLISFDKRYVYIEQIEQQDLFYQNPITQVKISRNAIDIIKKYIEKWSK